VTGYYYLSFYEEDKKEENIGHIIMLGFQFLILLAPCTNVFQTFQFTKKNFVAHLSGNPNVFQNLNLKWL
jgi:hypothetical protein